MWSASMMRKIFVDGEPTFFKPRNMQINDCRQSTVLAWNEPPNQTGKQVTFWSQSVQRMQQLRLWVPWVTEGYIHPLQPLLLTPVRLLLAF